MTNNYQDQGGQNQYQNLGYDRNIQIKQANGQINDPYQSSFDQYKPNKDSQQMQNDQYKNQGQQQQASNWYQAPTDDNLEYTKVGDLEFESRSGFVKKVYVLLTLELGSTILLTYFIMNFKSFGALLVVDNGNGTIAMTGFYIFVWVMCLALMITIMCYSHLTRKVPINYILTSLYVSFYGLLLGGICQMVNICFDDGQLMVWSAWLITFSLVISLTAYACITKTDMTMKGGIVYVLFMPLLCLMILSIFYYSYFLELIICALVIIVYGFILIMQTQMIMGGKVIYLFDSQKVKLSVDDYIIGSLMLYGSIVTLFLRILEIIVLIKGKK